jgi:hypothetical protein
LLPAPRPPFDGGLGLGLRNTASNFTFNHIGRFAAAGHAVAKSLFLSGVTRRFPDVNFGFLEGGVGWGCQLFADLTRLEQSDQISHERLAETQGVIETGAKIWC